MGGDGDHVMESKRIRLRYAGTCRVCGLELPAKTEAIYETSGKTVLCLTHDDPDQPDLEGEPFDGGTPGGSARREYERRKAKREEQMRAKHPRLGGIILALGAEPHSTRSWETGASGEERLGSRLNEFASEWLRVLHDRRIPGTKANIDHLVVAPTGVYVIDAKKYKGRPRLRVEGGLVRARVERLMVGTRDCTKIVDGVIKQVELVRTALGEDVPVHGVLCFVEADWPLIGGAFTTRGIEALWPKRLVSRLTADGPIASPVIDDIHAQLAAAFPPA